MKNIIMTAILLISVAFSVACGKHDHPSHSATAGTAPGKSGHDQILLSDESRLSIGIQTEAVTKRKDRSFLKAMGKVIIPLDRQAIISYAFTARVAEGHVDLGERVSKGQPLVTLESEEVGSAMSEFYKTSADLELSSMNLEREKRLFDNGVAPKKNLLAAETNFKIAQVNRETAEKKLHVLGFNEQQVLQISRSHQISPRITLFSPIAGKVVSSRLVRGMMTEPATEILVIVDLHEVWIDAEIYEKDIAQIKIGQKVEARVPAYPDKAFSGRIGYISDTIQEETRTVTVRIQVQNQEETLKPGMFADLHIFCNGSREILAIPVSAVLEESGETIVFIQAGNHFSRRPIQTGSCIDGTWEVVAGLQLGEKVVTQGLLHLKSMLSESLRQSAHIH